MRRVIMKPPKIFTRGEGDGSEDPCNVENPPAMSAADSGDDNAPTMITDEMALVMPISGECSAGVTRQTTW